MKTKINIVIKCQNYLKDFNFSSALIAKSARDQLGIRGFRGKFEIEVIFAGARRIRSLNKKYRNADSTTDVLSFPIDENVSHDFDGLLGSIVICPEIAKENIKGEKQSLESEIMFLIAHAVDHLVGKHH